MRVDGEQGQRRGHGAEAIPPGRGDALRSATVRSPSSLLTAVASLTALVLLVGACATGDGKTLRPPEAGATAPPPETDAPDDVEEVDALDPDATLPSLPVTTAPTSLGGADAVTVTIPTDADPTDFAAFAPWTDGSAIEEIYTCDGLDASPPVSWLGLPEGTQEIAITMVDETTVQRGRSFVHWVLGGISPDTSTLIEGILPDGAVQGINYFGNIRYDGPCPEPGARHDYLLRVHALGEPLGLPDGTPADEMVDAIESRSIETVTIVGSYLR